MDPLNHSQFKRSNQREAWSLAFRRLAYAVPVIGTITAACFAMWFVVAPMGVTLSEAVMLCLFSINVVWIALWFWNAILGFVILSGAKNPATVAMPILQRLEKSRPLKGRTAIVMPICNEDPKRTFERFEATYRSIEKADAASSFEFFILSDTFDPSIATEEFNSFNHLKRRLSCSTLHYRRREKNPGRKAGNIADFGRSWGNQFDYFIVLDADSVMSGDVVCDLVRLMDRSPEVGIIQTVPRPILATTLFGRLQQFSARITAEIVNTGASFWQQKDANYFGHNAIIRSRAFFENCNLPTLSGSGPLSGEILSHDFVEAAYMRRAGYSIWSLPIKSGSYEEIPPTLTEFEVRDRRWCKGNLQHAKILFERSLHPISRFHLIAGIMSYFSSPLWLGFIIASFWNLLERENPSLSYQGPASGLFSVAPGEINESAVIVFSAIMAMFIIPKLLSVALIITDKNERQRYGGFLRLILSTVLEVITSILLAPVLMLSHTWFIISILTGTKVEWSAQARDLNFLTLKAGVKLKGHCAIVGLLSLMAILCLAPTSVLWFFPLFIGPIAAPIMAVLSAHKMRTADGQTLLFQMPEEHTPSTEIAPLLGTSAYLKPKG